MLLHRVTEHVRAQNWTAIALDFLVVVGGIFVGLQVSNWVVFDEQVDAVKSSFILLQDWRLAYSAPFFNKVTFRINTKESSFENSGAIQSFDLDEMRADKKLSTSLQIMYQVNENMYYLLKQQRERAQNVREELSKNGF